MTAAAATLDPPVVTPAPRVGVLSQVGPLARRSVLRTLRQPGEYVPAIIMPLVIMAIFSGGLRSSTQLVGFPTRSYFAFIFGAMFVQGAITNGINSGGALALDIQSGFLRRLGLTTVRPTALLAAQLSGALVVGLIQVVVFLVIGLLFGIQIAAGVLGMLAIVAFHMLITIAFAALGTLLALRTGSAEVVQGIAPALTFLMLLSSYMLPRALIEITWFRAITNINPMSYLIEGERALVIAGWDGVAISRFLLVSGGLVLVFVVACEAAFVRRMAQR